MGTGDDDNNGLWDAAKFVSAILGIAFLVLFVISVVISLIAFLVVNVGTCRAATVTCYNDAGVAIYTDAHTAGRVLTEEDGGVYFRDSSNVYVHLTRATCVWVCE